MATKDKTVTDLLRDAYNAGYSAADNGRDTNFRGWLRKAREAAPNLIPLPPGATANTENHEHP